MQPAYLQRRVFQSIADEIGQDYKSTGTDDMLEKKSIHLRILLGEDFDRAMSDFDSQKITQLTDEYDRKLFMIETSPCKYYFIFKNVDHCTCHSFKHRVLKANPESLTCKHIIMVRIADAMARCKERKIPHEKLSELLFRPCEINSFNKTEIVLAAGRVEIDDFLAEQEDEEKDGEENVLSQLRSQASSQPQVSYTQASQLLQDLGVSPTKQT